MADFEFQFDHLETVQSFKTADDADQRYYLSLTPQERLCILEHLRALNHGNRTGPELQNVFEFTRASRR